MRSSSVLAAGTWNAANAVDTVLLDFDRRHRRRVRLRTEGGRELLLDLARAARLRDGDGLLLQDGGIVRVQARPESLTEIRAGGQRDLVRIAWHLGNRHLPVQLLDGCIRIRADHVIEAMVALLGGRISHVDAPFEPEAGAYANGHHHGVDDEPGEDHNHH
jgi:urease accessory protein